MHRILNFFTKFILYTKESINSGDIKIQYWILNFKKFIFFWILLHIINIIIDKKIAFFISLIFIVNIASYVYADDDDLWQEAETTQTDNNVVGTGTSSADVVEPLNENSNTANASNYTTDLNEDDDNWADTNNNTAETMPKTGIEDNSLVFVVIVISLIVAGYSYKKLSDYNNL